jgi:hypothetical protein
MFGTTREKVYEMANALLGLIGDEVLFIFFPMYEAADLCMRSIMHIQTL